MLVVLLLAGTLQAPARQDTLLLTLEQAVIRSETMSPAVAAAVGEVGRARGLRAEALWPFPTNPAIDVGRTRRRVGSVTTHDRDWSVSQEIEIAGQSFGRRGAASAQLRGAESRVTDARRLAALEVRQVYLTLALSQRERFLTDTAAAFAQRLAEFARRQFDAGEINRLELNAAVLDAARARSVADRALAGAESAGADLARLLALPPDSAVGTAGLPPLPALLPDSVGSLLRYALARRPDLLAADAEQLSASKRLSVARRAFIPNLTVAAVGGQEGGTDDLLGFQFGVQLPLFYRGQADRGAAEADLAGARAVRATTVRAIQAELEAGVARLRRALAAEHRFAREVLGAASENVTLTERALAEGEVDLTDVILLRRTALDAQREYLAVLTDAYGAWFEVAAALAVSPLELPALLTGTN